ncbi:MAG: nuclear transport factor 2 family protein [Myxococcales bacterium]|nr:nuclear transport factor 2 family protein [Myxococcales bacterium]
MEPGDLIEIERIKQLKARYFRLMDQKLWDEFALLFTEEVEQSWQSAPGEPPAGARGRDAVVDFIRGALEGMRSTHHGHMPEIEITDASTAVGTWALHDYCTAGGETVFNGAGYYRDEYAKRDGRWLIHRTHLEAEPF